MVSVIARGFFGTLLKGFFSRLSQKESEREMSQAEQGSSFAVHSPKWMFALFALFMAAILAAGIFLFTKGIKFSLVGTALAECILVTIILYEKEYHIRIEGQEIFFDRTFLGSRTFFLKDITNCTKDNAGTIRITFGRDKIFISPLKVNAERFYELARKALYDHVDSQKLAPYKIIRNKGKRKFILFCASIAAALLFIFLSDKEKMPLAEYIKAFTVFGGIIAAALLYFPAVNKRSIIVDEQARTFSYVKGFKRHSVNFYQIEEIAEKKRLCEEVAVNYQLTFYDERTLKKKISSLDKNAVRFALLLFKLFEDANNEA